MTDAEFHQQELEHQQWLEETEARVKRINQIKEEMGVNHSQMVGVLQFMRDDVSGRTDVCIDSLMKLLEEYEDMMRRVKK